MTKYCVYDLETVVKLTGHKSDAKDPSNRFHTVIYGTAINDIKVIHQEEAPNRRLPYEFLEELATADVLIGHNIKFDINYIWKENPEFHDFISKGGQIFDTQLCEYLLTGQRHQFASLAELQYKYLGLKVKKERISKLFKKGVGADAIIKNKDRCPRVFALFHQYAIDDGKTTLQIFAKQVERAKELGMMKIIKMYNKYLLCLCMMENNGMHIDLKRCQDTMQDFSMRYVTHLNNAVKVCEHLWPKELHKFNPNSAKDASAMLFGATMKYKEKEPDGFYLNGNPKTKTVEKEVQVVGFGLNPIYYSQATKNVGQYKKDKDVIDLILSKTKDPLVKEFCLEMRQAAKYKHMNSTYLSAFMDMSIDGVLYPNLNNTATITSRLSSSSPNCQNLPKRDKEMNRAIMGLIHAPRNWKAVSIDFSMLEIYIEAYLSRDPALIQDLLSGIDFHCLRLSYIESKSYEEIYKLCKLDNNPAWKTKRDQAKTLSYQKAYGAYIDTIAESSGISRELVQEVFDKEDLRYPLAKEYNDRVEEEANKNQTVSLLKNMSRTAGLRVKHHCGYELLPIKDKATGSYYFDKDEPRHLGWYVSPTCKRYTFEEQCTKSKNGQLYRRFERTKITNYSKQGCIRGDTKIITPTGMYTIENLVNKKNLVVWSKDGWSNANCVDAGLKEEIEIELKDGTIMHCSPKHKFLCIHPEDGREHWKTAHEIVNRTGKLRTCIKYGTPISLNEDVVFKNFCPKVVPNGYNKTSFNRIGNNRVLGQLLGRIASDGSVRENKSVSFFFAEHEIEVENILKPYIYELATPSVRQKTNHTQYVRQYTLNSTELARQGYELKKCIPHQCWTNTELMAGYLSGMFDGDGMANHRGALLTFGQGEYKYKWAAEIQLALRMFGIRSRLRKQHHRTDVVIMTGDSPLFAKKIGFINSRKQKKIEMVIPKRQKHDFGYVRHAKYTGRQIQMYDIVDSKDEMFCANGLVTHNTASDIQAITSVGLYRLLFANREHIKLINEIHDSKWFYIKESHLSLLIPQICTIMCKVNELFQEHLGIEMPFDFKVDVEIGDNFGEMISYEQYKKLVESSAVNNEY